MVSKKLLIGGGGVATVGSVATAAVIANKNNETSDSREARPASKSPKELKTEALRRTIEENRGKVTSWLERNKTETSNLKIQVEDVDKKVKELSEIDPGGMSDYLEQNSELLKSLASGTETTFTFRKKEGGGWENVFNKDQITSWINNSFKDKSVFRFNESNEREEIKDVNELSSFFEPLRDKENLFTGLKSTSEKEVLFEKDWWGAWAHTKTDIEQRGKNSNFEIKIRKGGKEIDIDKAEENDLIGLMAYYDKAETWVQLNKFKNPKETITWVFEKKGTDWKSIYSAKTINSWIKNASNERASLRLFEDGIEKPLSEINNEDELEQLFNAVTAEFNNPFKWSSKDYVVVFEKYKEYEKTNKIWMHTKEALGWVASDLKWSNLDPIKIQINDDTKERKKVKEVEDEELIGLLKHMESKKDAYKEKSCLILRKDGDTWLEVADESCK